MSYVQIMFLKFAVDFKVIIGRHLNLRRVLSLVNETCGIIVGVYWEL